MSLNLPPSWGRMSDHAKACYLVDSHQARDYSDARRKVGRRKREERNRITVAVYLARMEKMGLA